MREAEPTERPGSLEMTIYELATTDVNDSARFMLAECRQCTVQDATDLYLPHTAIVANPIAQPEFPPGLYLRYGCEVGHSWTRVIPLPDPGTIYRVRTSTEAEEPSKALNQYHAELRRVRLTAGGTQQPLPESIYAAVVASGPCAYCGASASHADHVRPVSRGGADDTGNLTPSCGACNNSKGAKLLTEWHPDKVAHGVKHSKVVEIEYARLTQTVVR